MSGFLMKSTKYIKSNKGTSMVEFALVLPLLLLLFGAIIDFGYMMHQYLVVDEVARGAARYVTINKDHQTARNLIIKAKEDALHGTGDVSNWKMDCKIVFDQINPTTEQPVSRSKVMVTVSCDRVKLNGLVDGVVDFTSLDKITRSVVAMTE